MKNMFSSKIAFFWLAVLFIWAKSYSAYLIEFNLGVNNAIQEFLLAFNPIGSAIVFLGLALFAKGKRAGIWIIVIDFILSFILYANVLYYRFFDDFITLPTLMQTSNFGSLGGSILGLIEPHDFLYVIDLIILGIIYAVRKVNWSPMRMQLRASIPIFMVGIITCTVNLGLAEIDRPQLLERTFDRNYLVKYLGAYNYTIYDAIQSTKTSTQRVMASKSDIAKVEEYTEKNYAEPNEKYFGKAEGMNVIKIHLESFQNFLINYELNGEEVTPFLNSLVNNGENEMMYFDNIFHQTGQGKTADAELMLDTSLYGLPQGSAFSVKGNNTYQAAPAILDQEKGYTSAVFHGDNKTFWNRDSVYKQFGVDKFFDDTHYDMSEENVINYGLKDKPFFEESMPMLESLEEPFYSHLMTLTHHFPFMINEEEASIEPADTGDGVVDRYFQTARYLDEAVKNFFNDLKESGLYDNSVVLIYGDHHGISENHNTAMKQILGEEVTPYKNAQMQRVPLMIHAPGVEGGTKHQYGGLTDVLPTLLHLLGVDTEKYIQFGTDLLSPEHKGLVPFRNGNFVTEKYTKVDGNYYDTKTGDKLEPTEEMKELNKKVGKELELSDEVLYGDLLRFYQPEEDWTPVDTSEYSYVNTKDDTKEEEEDSNNE